MIPARPSVTSSRLDRGDARRRDERREKRRRTRPRDGRPAGPSRGARCAPRRTRRRGRGSRTGRRTAHSSAPKTRTIPERSHGNRIGVPAGSPSGVVGGRERLRAAREDVARADGPAALVGGEEVGAPEEDRAGGARRPRARAAKRRRPDASGSSGERPADTTAEYTEARTPGRARVILSARCPTRPFRRSRSR